MELHIVNFIKALPPRDRSFYLLMRSYERDLNDIVNQNLLSNEYTRETLRGIAEMYESELLPLIESNAKSPIYDNQFTRNENAEPSSSECIMKTSNKLTNIVKQSSDDDRTVSLFDTKEFDEFAESLGPWASSFSSSSVELLQDSMIPQCPANDDIKASSIHSTDLGQLVICNNNDSDLSTDED